MNYTLYEKTTGKITNIIFVSTLKDLKLNLKENEDFIAGHFDSLQYYISISTKTAISKPQKPEGAWVFDYSTKSWVQDLQAQWTKIRQIRNELLQLSDWTQMPDVSLSTKEAWASYRQSLRNITDQSDPFNITWPTPPS